MYSGGFEGLFGGGGGGEGYVSPRASEYEDVAAGGIYNRLGARKVKTKKPKPKPEDYGLVPTGSPQSSMLSNQPGYMQSQMRYNQALADWQESGGEREEWDYSQVGKPITPSQAMGQYPTSFRKYDEAMEATKKPTEFKETYSSTYKPVAYNAAKFNFQSLPKEYGDIAYQRGAKDIRREGQGQLEKLAETIGPRRPGLLLKAGEQSQRDIGESLADLQSDIRLKEMEKATDLGVQQQVEQAAENYKTAGFSEDQARKMAEESYKGYESRATKEARQADENYRRANDYLTAAANRINLIRGVTESERGYKDKAMEYLLQLFGDVIGSQNQAAQIDEQARGNTLGFISDLIPF